MDGKIDRYYNLAIRFLSYRPRSEKEVLDYLNKKLQRSTILPEEHEKASAQIMARLSEYNYINDLDFAKFWIEQRLRGKRKPLKIIQYELTQKGIKKEIAISLLQEYPEGHDLENAKELARKKLDFLRKETPAKRKEKAINSLLRKGFSFDVAKKAVEFYKV